MAIEKITAYSLEEIQLWAENKLLTVFSQLTF